jgi:Methyltransferase domain
MQVDFAEYALAHLPPAPARVLEVGCGEEGGVAPTLAKAGYDVLAIDPEAPRGPFYRRTTLEELDDPGPFDATVAGRVLHHIDPLGPGLDKLARLGPLLVVDEFACNHVDEAARAWYECEYRRLAAAGSPPQGPHDLGEWRAAHPHLHPYETLRAELDARYETRDFRWRPYLYRWLRAPGTEALEESLIAAGAIRPIGFRYVGSARGWRSCTCAARDPEADPSRGPSREIPTRGARPGAAGAAAQACSSRP